MSVKYSHSLIFGILLSQEDDSVSKDAKDCIPFGVKVSSMGDMMNGQFSTFLQFSDYGLYFSEGGGNFGNYAIDSLEKPSTKEIEKAEAWLAANEIKFSGYAQWFWVGDVR